MRPLKGIDEHQDHSALEVEVQKFLLVISWNIDLFDVRTITKRLSRVFPFQIFEVLDLSNLRITILVFLISKGILVISKMKQGRSNCKNHLGNMNRIKQKFKMEFILKKFPNFFKNLLLETNRRFVSSRRNDFKEK